MYISSGSCRCAEKPFAPWQRVVSILDTATIVTEKNVFFPILAIFSRIVNNVCPFYHRHTKKAAMDDLKSSINTSQGKRRRALPCNPPKRIFLFGISSPKHSSQLFIKFKFLSNLF